MIMMMMIINRMKGRMNESMNGSALVMRDASTAHNLLM